MLIPVEKIHETIDLYKSNVFKPGFIEQMRYFKKQLSKSQQFGNLYFGIKVMEFAKKLIK